MISLPDRTLAVDSNMLLDVLLEDPVYAAESRARLNAASVAGSLMVSEPVIAEISSVFDGVDELEQFLARTRLERTSLSTVALFRAGAAWREYTRRRPRGLRCAPCGAANDVGCEQCGEPITARQHLVADFLIGAHALEHAGRLLTRDRGFYSTYFPDLDLV